MYRTHSNYQAWEVREDEFPSNSALSERVKFLLGYGVLAPSTHNTQPWSFSVKDGLLTISAEEDRRLPASDPSNLLASFSLGACLMNIFVAANHFGLSTKYSTAEGGSSVKVSFGTRGSTNLKMLFPGILSRRSHKIGFSPHKIPAELIDEINEIKYGSATIRFSTNPEKIDDLARLHRDSTLEFSNNGRFTAEVGKWMRMSGTKKYDGMPGFTFGLKGPQPLIAKIMTRLTPKSVSRVAMSDFRAIKTSTMIGAVLTTRGATAESHIEAGLAYEHLGLLLALSKFYLAPKAAIIQAGHSSDLAHILDTKANPVLYFAAGFVSNPLSHSPRRTREMTLKGAQ